MKIIFLFLILAFYGFGQSPYGDWFTTLKAADLPLVFHIKKESGKNIVSVDSPKQKAFDMPAKITFSEGNNIKVEMGKIGVSFEGTYCSDSLSGIFKQGPILEEMTFYKKPIEPKKVKRPQNPKAPYSYDQEEVKFENVEDSLLLAGTYTYPKNKTNIPAIVLVSGSGPQNRDEEMMGHRPFWILADYLSNLGYAVLRYDDRGTFNSAGDFASATTTDFVNDAASAVYYLQSRPEVDASRIVVLGHSEGGLIANILGTKISNLSGIISLAGTSIRGDSILKIQTRLMAESIGEKGAQLELTHAFNTALWDAVINSKNIEEFGVDLKSISKKFVKKFRKKKFIEKSEEAEIIQSVKMSMLNPWMYEFIRYSPSIHIPKISCHVLVLIGSRDIQVTSKENIIGYENLLPINDKLHELKELEGLNHLFQRCNTCTISEYGQIEETFSAIALEEIRSFLEKIWIK